MTWNESYIRSFGHYFSVTPPFLASGKWWLIMTFLSGSCRRSLSLTPGYAQLIESLRLYSSKSLQIACTLSQPKKIQSLKLNENVYKLIFLYLGRWWFLPWCLYTRFTPRGTCLLTRWGPRACWVCWQSPSKLWMFQTQIW